ncbi:MAG TPA: fibronectin type III domain-containing protein [Puia sp.]|jgi:predicted esterase
MKISTPTISVVSMLLILLFSPPVRGQSILNPADPVVNYNPASPPASPAYGTIGKWVRTARLGWNTGGYKAYIYKNNPFRLYFPHTYNSTAADGKKYPLLIFFHGNGEGASTIYDNEYSLYHGGQFFAQNVDNGTFDGYVLVMQTSGGWGPAQYGPLKEIIDYMVANNKLDQFRVYTNGLSGGGAAAWEMYLDYPTYISTLIPMSSVVIQYAADPIANLVKFTPIWNIHGGLDGFPNAYTASQVNNALLAKGANYTDLNMPTQGHDTWDSTWLLPAFWPFLKKGYSSNPWTLFGRTLFCPGDPIDVTIGVVTGFSAYQWRKDGVVIPGATSNTIHVTAMGTYDCRVQRGGTWSDWSPVPVVIGTKPPTVTPPITVSGLMSKVIPAPDGSAGVNLSEPAGYTSYQWQKQPGGSVAGSSRIYRATTPGNYVAEVTEQYGCSTSFSPPFTVVDANGPNKPDPASGLSVTSLSSTSLVLNWIQNPSPVNNETNFEVYQAQQSGGPYKLVAITGADVSNYTVANLNSSVKYYYIVRAVNNTGAAAVSGEASGTTTADTQPPTAPANLVIAATSRGSVSLGWGASTDNAGIKEYDVYINGVKTYVVAPGQQLFTIYNLTYQQSYTFVVRAVDVAGNISPASNQVSGQPVGDGLSYKFYPQANVPSVLPNLSTQTPTAIGTVPDFTLAPATQPTSYCFLFEGYLQITTAGTYEFQTSSSAGSKFHIGALNGATAYPGGTVLVSNDGVHANTTVTSSAVTLQAGVYPIAVDYFQASGTASLIVSWKTPGSSDFVPIPASALAQAANANGQAPAVPSNLNAVAGSYNRVNLSWTDNSSNETGFELWRSTSSAGTYSIAGTTGSGVVSFTDSTALPGTAYSYEVRAVGQYGQSAFSNSRSVSTPVLPSAPAAPTSLAALAASPSSIGLTWTGNTGNVDGYQVYRSANNNLNYVLTTTLPGTSAGYTDTALFANAFYYYKIRAVNAGGSSSFSNESGVRTLDYPPVISKLSDQQARYGTTTSIPLSATHAGGGALVFTGVGLPPFAVLTDNHNGTAALVLNPAITDQNSYSDLQVIVTDIYGKSDTTKFNLVVNNNYTPVIDTIASYTINEGDSLSVPLRGQDQNATDVLSFSVSGAPAGYVITPVSNGVATLVLHPGYAAAGVYSIQVKMADNNGLYGLRSFGLTVKDRSPGMKIFARTAYQDPTAIGLPWNALVGTSTTGLLESSGKVTPVGLVFSPTGWWNTFNGGSSTGNNSGVYPDRVLQDYLWWGSIYNGPDVVNGQVTGLDVLQQYSLTFFANSVYNGVANNGTSTYTVGSQTVSLYVQDNRSNTATISNIKPAADGTISFQMGKTATTSLGYLNAMVITQQYDDGMAPAGPSGLTGQAVPGSVQLSWSDSAYNATGYEIWRAPAATGVFALVGKASGNATGSYGDSTVAGNAKYLYTVRAYNSYGYSGYTDTVALMTLNRLPKVNPIADVTLKNNQQQSISVTTVDDPGIKLVLTAKGLPPFATFTDNGDGTGTIAVAPPAGTAGIYPNVTVTAADPQDSLATANFTLVVTEPNVSSVYVNFTGGAVCAKPWNTLLTAPYGGTVMSGLLDDGNNPTNISLGMPDGFYGLGSTGRFTGNNDGIYAPVVMRNGLTEPSAAVRRLQVAGLDQSKQYNFVFFNSQEDGTNGLTNFTINGQTVTLQADYNINKTVQINGVRPDSSNGVTISVAKASGAVNAYLSAVVIQAYDTAAGLLLNPADLRVLSITQHTVKLQWQDRSANETGFEVWRSNDSGVYAKLTVLPAGTVSYMDSMLTANKNYYYIVRAARDTVYSDYSNVAAATTVSEMVYVNVNYLDNAGAPWNNLAALPTQWFTWYNFKDSSGGQTNIGMVQTQDFAGLNSLGMRTGNNSGVYPDLVLRDDYVAFQGQVGGLQLFGLDISKKYDLTFLGSDSLTGDNTSAYAVNGDTVFLDATLNTIGTVTMHGVTPDNTGRIDIHILPYGQASGGGWVNAMVFQGYTPSAAHAPAPPSGTGPGGAPPTSPPTSPPDSVSTPPPGVDTLIRAYPNPYHESFTLKVPGLDGRQRVSVTIFDIAGRQVFDKEFSNLVPGDNFLLINASQGMGSFGVYFVRVAYGGGKTVKMFKLLRE